MFAPATVERGLNVSHGDDSKLVVWFENEPVEYKAESLKAGRPIYRDIPYVHIVIPGDKNTEVSRKATEEDKQRFAKQWAAFQNQNEQVQDGTPLEQWPLLSRSQVKEFKALHIHTVENLAALNDTVISKLGMGARSIVAQAKTFLQTAKDSAVATKLTAEIEKKDAQIADLQRQLSDLASRIEKQEKRETLTLKPK